MKYASIIGKLTWTESYYESGVICYSWFVSNVICFNEDGIQTHNFRVKNWK